MDECKRKDQLDMKLISMPLVIIIAMVISVGSILASVIAIVMLLAGYWK